MARHPQNIVQNRSMDWDVTCSRWPIAINMCYRRELSLLDKKQDLCLANNALYYSLNLEQQFSLVGIYENIHMLPKRNKGPPASSGEKRWDRLHSVAIWLDMPYKILTHWTWLNCGIFHPERRSLLHRSLRLLQCSSGYMTFSKSCKDRMILSSWKQGEDIPMKPAWTSTIQNSVAAPAGSSLALGMPSLSGSWDWSVLQPWAALGHTKHRVFSWAWCPAQAVCTGLVPVLSPHMSLTLGVQTCSWLCAPQTQMEWQVWSDKKTALREHFLPEIPVQTQNMCNLATSASLRLQEPKLQTERYKGNPGLLLKHWNFTLR